MKRIISFFLVICMMFCTGISAFAAPIEKTYHAALFSGDLKINLTGSDKAKIEGAEFEIYNADTNVLDQVITTNGSGFAHANYLLLGDYYFVQKSTPVPYLFDEDRHEFTLAERNQSHVADVENTVDSTPGEVKIKKTDENGAPLAQIAFDVFAASDDKKAGTLLTDKGGNASLKLPFGSYCLKETATAPGYILLTEAIPFALSAKAVTTELPIINKKEPSKIEHGQIQLMKKDADSGALLPGATFGIYRVSDHGKVDEITTGSDGTVTTLPLPIGDYYLQELRAPSGYIMDAKKHKTTVVTEKTTELTLLNQHLPAETGTVKIIKTDAADSNKKLSGASFSIYQTNGGKKVGELLTGKDGTAVLELPEGDYTIKETTAPEGYVLSTESISLHLKVGETRELTVKNSKIEPVKPAEPGTLRIIKQDKDGGKKLKDAVFGVYRSDDDKKIDELTTDRKGIAETELPVGEYYIRELEAPEGYKLKKAEVNFHITTGETTELTVKNAKEDSEDETGTLRIIKEDKETGDPLKNAVFTIYDSDDEEIDELTTGKDGAAELDLPVGSYYLRESEAPKGYKLDRKKIAFKVTADKTVKVTVENVREKEADKTGTLQIVKSAAGTGKRLEGAVFAVYAASGDKKLSELTTDQIGVATLDLAPGDYYLRELNAPDGFKVETARILFTIKADGKTIAEITNEKDMGEPTPAPEQPTAPTNPTTPTDPATPTIPEITLPKTGEAFPTLQYALAALCFGVAALCGVALYRRKRVNQTGRNPINLLK